MSIDADFILDKDAQKLADEAAKSSMCIQLGRRKLLVKINKKKKPLLKRFKKNTFTSVFNLS